MIFTDYSEKEGFRAFSKLMEMDERPTAVFCHNYHTTAGAIKASYKYDISIPDNLSFIGFDNLGIADIVKPSLTMIEQPMHEMGKEAARLLLQRIEKEEIGFPKDIRLKARLIERNSVKYNS
jgi:LacI family transcriptional regulator